MKFCWCTVTVKNMEESLRFYQEIVGLPLDQRFTPGPDTEISFLGDRETKIELIYNPNNIVTGNVEGISLGFEVKSVDEMIKFIEEKGLHVHSGPFQPTPQVRFFFVKDPNGITIQFVENIS